MCGRYQFTAEQCEEIRQIAEAIQRKYGSQNWAPGEIRPANHAPVLTETGGEITPRLMKWGYQLPGTLVINARAETAAEKPLFRDSVRMRRCLIPSTGFYEWDSRKRKYLFTLPEEDALYMAGLYDRRGGEDCALAHGRRRGGGVSRHRAAGAAASVSRGADQSVVKSMSAMWPSKLIVFLENCQLDNSNV